MMVSLQDPTPSVKERTLFAIEALCEHLGEKEVVPYMGPLMQVRQGLRVQGFRV
jgi:hypothetical protein